MPNPLARDLDECVGRNAGLLADLRGARLFVTGGTGFFGHWLLETLMWANERLALRASAVVLTRRPTAFREAAPHLASDPAITLCAGDVRSFDFPDGRFTHVIHAAVDAAAPSDRGGALREFESTIEGTRRALEFASRSGAQRFLFTSSGSIYGRQPVDLPHVGEDYGGGPSPASTSAAGAESKRAAEALCALCAGPDLVTTIARCFGFVGPYLPLDGKFAIGNFIRDALDGGPVRVAGDGTPYRSYLYAADLVAWLWTVLLKGEPARPYNVGSEDAVSIAELAGTVARVLAPDAKVEIAGRPVPGRAAARYVPSTSRIRGELGVSVTVGLEDGLRRTAEWHRAVRRAAGARA